jgi:ZIP family zinc transporter
VIVEALLWGAAIGGALLVGAVAGAFLPERERTATTVATVGGGMLLGALAFDVVPQANEHAGLWVTAAGLAAGTLGFLAIDWLLTRDEAREDLRRALQGGQAPAGPEAAGRGKSIALGVFLDGVPETAALGITLAEGAIGIPLLAAVLVSNLSESYGASEPLVEAGYSRGFPILLFGGIAVALVVAIVLGATVLADAPDRVIGAAEAVAGGAIFATVLVAIVPHAFAEVSRWAAVAASAGFIAAFLLA